MRYAELVSILDKIKYKDTEVSHLYFPAMTPTDEDVVRIFATMPVLDRDTKQSTVISKSILLSEAECGDIRKESLIRLVYKLIIELELHEAAECFYYNGVRIYDPHKSP
jgi:hypothetical protein